MRSILTPLVVILALAAGAASLGAHSTTTGAAHPAVAFRSVTRTAIAGSEQAGMSTTVRGWADGARGRVDFEGGDRALVSEGSVLFTEDGAETAMLFDAPRRVCSAWPGEPTAAPGRVSPAVQIEDLSVAQVLDEAGPEIAGLPTRHYRFEISWRAPTQAGSPPAKEGGAGHDSRSEAIEDLWVTSRLDDPGLRLWLHARTSPTGDLDADGRIQAALDEVDGILLKRETRLRVVRSGQKLETIVTLEVTELERRPAPPGTFEAPETCRASGQQPVS